MTQAKLASYWWAYLAVMIYRFGGVAGATRRIVFAWPGDFTCGQIEASVHALYPGLRPGEHQVADVIEWMREREPFNIGGGLWSVIYKAEVKS